MSGPHHSPWEPPRQDGHSAGPPPYGAPPGHNWQPQYGAPEPAPTRPGGQKQSNPLGIAALGVAVAGTILSCIPGIMWVGWLLLPVALILSLIAVTSGDKPKGFGIAGIGMTLFGTGVALIAFVLLSTTVITGLFDRLNTTIGASGEGHSESILDPEPGTAGNPDASASPDADTHTRENPARLGERVSIEDWDIVVNSFTRDGTDEVMEANPYNDPPPTGSDHALINVTVTYTGDDTGRAYMAGPAYVTEDGTVIRWFDEISPTVVPDRLDGELYNGASATGNIGIAVPRGDNGLLRVGRTGFGATAFIDPGEG